MDSMTCVTMDLSCQFNIFSKLNSDNRVTTFMEVTVCSYRTSMFHNFIICRTIITWGFLVYPGSHRKRVVPLNGQIIARKKTSPCGAFAKRVIHSREQQRTAGNCLELNTQHRWTNFGIFNHVFI